MSARYVILCAAFVALVFAAVAAVLIFNTSQTSRSAGTVAEYLTNSSADQVKSAGSIEQVQPATNTQSPKVSDTPPADKSEKSARAQLLGNVDNGLREMAEKQSTVNETTSQLAVNLDDQENQWSDDLKATLKEVVSGQAEVQRLAARMLRTLKEGKLDELASGMEQIQRLLAAIMGALEAKVPDLGYLTLEMQEGVNQQLQAMLEGMQAQRDLLMEEQPIKPATTQGSDSLTVGANHRSDLRGDNSFTNLTIEKGAKLKLGSGTLTVSGDFRNEGEIEGSQATLVMSGGNQNFSGNASFNKVHFSGGTKHISAGSNLITTYGQNSGKDQPVLVVEAGTTLIIDQDATVNIPNAYGLRVAGTLIIDGGTFHCSFTHGDGKDPGTSSVANNGMNKSWVPGCQLIIRSGSFIGDGDASFAGASVYVQGGELRIHDDIWGSGDLLEISGGVMSNDSSGGMFAFSGVVRLNGGRLEINQYEGRGLYVTKEAEIWSLGGEVVIGGQDVSSATSGMVLAHDVQLPNLTLNVSTRISTNTPDGTTLSVSGNITIGKAKKLVAQGRRVIGNIETGEEFGLFEP
jgi:hypothetical protein